MCDHVKTLRKIRRYMEYGSPDYKEDVRLYLQKCTIVTFDYYCSFFLTLNFKQNIQRYNNIMHHHVVATVALSAVKDEDVPFVCWSLLGDRVTLDQVRQICCRFDPLPCLAAAWYSRQVLAPIMCIGDENMEDFALFSKLYSYTAECKADESMASCCPSGCILYLIYRLLAGDEHVIATCGVDPLHTMVALCNIKPNSYIHQLMYAIPKISHYNVNSLYSKAKVRTTNLLSNVLMTETQAMDDLEPLANVGSTEMMNMSTSDSGIDLISLH